MRTAERERKHTVRWAILRRIRQCDIIPLVTFALLGVQVILLVLLSYQVNDLGVTSTRGANIAASKRVSPLEWNVDNDGHILSDVAAHGHGRSPTVAAVTVVEFGDFECPACAQDWPQTQQLLADYPNNVRFVYRHWIKEYLHPHARRAAEASECAAEQGRFWQMHNVLLANQQHLEFDALLGYGREIGLESEAFEHCLSSGRMAAVVQQDMDAGDRYGVTGTPTFFVNNRYAAGGPALERRVRRELGME